MSKIYTNWPFTLNPKQKRLLDKFSLSVGKMEIYFVRHTRRAGATSSALHYCYNFNHNFEKDSDVVNFFVSNRSFPAFTSVLPKDPNVEHASVNAFYNSLRGRDKVGCIILDETRISSGVLDKILWKIAYWQNKPQIIIIDDENGFGPLKKSVEENGYYIKNETLYLYQG